MSPHAAKRAYFRGRGIKPALARRYYRQLGAAERILDVGCGTGEFGRYRPAGTEVFGLDADPGAVERAARFEHAAAIDLDGAQLPYPDQSFDSALAKDILEHLQDPGSLALELYRVLRPGSVLLVSVVMAKPRAVWADYTHVRGFTKESARMLLDDVGFEVEAIWRMGAVPFAARLRFMPLVPLLLRLPIFSQLWAASWELRARRPHA
jgi:SAM-dependent methyltransferase